MDGLGRGACRRYYSALAARVRRTSGDNVPEREYGSGVSQAGTPHPRFDRSGQVGCAGRSPMKRNGTSDPTHDDGTVMNGAPKVLAERDAPNQMIRSRHANTRRGVDGDSARTPISANGGLSQFHAHGRSKTRGLDYLFSQPGGNVQGVRSWQGLLEFGFISPRDNLSTRPLLLSLRRLKQARCCEGGG